MPPRGSRRFVFSVRAVCIVVGGRIVTVLPATEDDLATVLVWTIMRTWVDD